jgi:hypothetical protein
VKRLIISLDSPSVIPGRDCNSTLDTKLRSRTFLVGGGSQSELPKTIFFRIYNILFGNHHITDGHMFLNARSATAFV